MGPGRFSLTSQETDAIAIGAEIQAMARPIRKSVLARADAAFSNFFATRAS